MPIIPATNAGIDDPAWAWPALVNSTHDGSGHHGSSGLGNWSSLIGIVTAIVGNMLIALALNVQRYSHIQLHRRRVEARHRARDAMHRVQNGVLHNGYGATESYTAYPLGPDEREDDDDALDAEDQPLAHSFQSSGSNWTESSADEPKVASTYLKSPSWWLGQVLMSVGEMGNFLAYGFAPASIVSPLGVVALIANCVIAPLFFGEHFRKRDFWGVIIAVAGAITVVLSAKGEETKLNPHDVWDAITTIEFEIYMGVTIFFIIVLMWASPRYGHRTILIDLGLVGLFGGYTALTTKGVSSMLSSTLLKAFTTPVTYGLILVLVVTAVMQVRYVNKALQSFDSTQVIPIQFVLFTLSVIIGSAVLYRDFERTTTEQAAKFIGGCLLTFFGVFLITSGRHRQDEEDRLPDDEDIEETIGLRDQEGSDSNPDHARQSSVQAAQASTSRRSSRTSIQRGSKPFGHQSSVGAFTALTNRKPSSTTLNFSEPAESSPLLYGDQEHPAHPGLPPTVSVDSVPTIHSVAVSESLYSIPSTPSPLHALTPRAPSTASRPHSHHFSKAFISPSPLSSLSSTVSAAVADKLLRGEDSPAGRRRSVRRRSTLRSSLFVPHGEIDRAGASDPLLISSAGDEQVPNHGDDEPLDNHHPARTRARSLSNTFKGIFSGRMAKSRVNSNPEPSESLSSGHSDSG
ncbi:DUF803-domain-containing protein [Xylariaceae sp. FL1019]|nr:DUF803-domain-containing protein [Xylariaceae sp. FL1019]